MHSPYEGSWPALAYISFFPSDMQNKTIWYLTGES